MIVRIATCFISIFRQWLRKKLLSLALGSEQFLILFLNGTGENFFMLVEDPSMNFYHKYLKSLPLINF